MNEIRLEQWSTSASPSDVYAAPECRALTLRGAVYGHLSYEDGEPIETSPVMHLNLDEGRAQTRDACYTLGTPSKEFLDYLASIDSDLYDKALNLAVKPAEVFNAEAPAALSGGLLGQGRD
jgi:hypothetical protein